MKLATVRTGPAAVGLRAADLGVVRARPERRNPIAAPGSLAVPGIGTGA